MAIHPTDLYREKSREQQIWEDASKLEARCDAALTGGRPSTIDSTGKVSVRIDATGLTGAGYDYLSYVSVQLCNKYKHAGWADAAVTLGDALWDVTLTAPPTGYC